MTHETKLLKDLTSTGQEKFWQGHVETTEDGVFTYTRSWQINKSGKKSKTNRSANKLIKGKNVGKANETTPFEQAVSEIESAAKRKMDKGYYDAAGTRPLQLPLPMLAHDYKKRKHHVNWSSPVFIQPKLDGTRMLLNRHEGWTRQGKYYDEQVIRHLIPTKMRDLPGWRKDIILDGELMLPADQFTFQDSISAIKKFDPLLSPQLQYHVYDIVDTFFSFGQRYGELKHFVEWLDNDQVILVPTHMIFSEFQMMDVHERFVREGYEGSIVRQGSAPYKLKNRSNNLLKYKDFIDDEFVIVGVEQGVGKERGCAIFTCVTTENKEFNVRPKGTTKQRQQMWQERDSMPGKNLTVRYQNLTDSGIPRFPVGLTIRDYE